MNLPTTKTEIQVRYSDLDTLGHVTNTVYAVYLELARVRWFLAVPDQLVASVVVNLNIDFLGEIKLEDSVYVATRCIKVGNKSIQLAQDIHANERCVTRAVTTVVGFDPVARKTVPLLAGWEPSVVEDQHSLDQ